MSELATRGSALSASLTIIGYATLLQSQDQRFGVTVTVEPLEVNAFVQSLTKGDLDAVLNAWRSDPSPAAVLQPWGRYPFLRRAPISVTSPTDRSPLWWILHHNRSTRCERATPTDVPSA